MPSVCMAWHWGTKKTKCVQYTQIDQNMVHKIKQDQNQRLELSWVQNNIEMSFRQSVKHMTCNNAKNLWKMHEHMEKCLNTCSNCHKGPTQMHKYRMGLSLIKELKKISQTLESQPNFWKSPILKTLSTDSA